MAKPHTAAKLPASLLWMVLLSLVLQVAAIGVFRQYRIRTADDHFGFGWEMGRIGRSLALGQGFSNPYGGSTGPTAWEPPLYPYLIGGVFKVFGIYSTASAWVLLSINSLFNSLTCIPIFLIGRRAVGEKFAIWSAWTWALLPYEMYWAIHWVWDTTLGPLLLTSVFFVSLELEECDGWRGWLIYGLLWGVIGLSNPSLLSFLPFSGIWIWYRRYRRGVSSFTRVVAAAAVFFACLTPWLVRNHQTFGRFVFVRNDFGLQFRLGNGPGADGRSLVYLQPNLNPSEFEAFRRMGELAYAERCKQIALQWIAEDPARFAMVSLKRFFYFWGGLTKPTNSTTVIDFRNSLFLGTSILALCGLGLALKRKMPGSGLFLWLMLSYPTVYYFVYPHARYRHPIEPEMVLLIVYLFWQMRPQPKAAPASSQS